MFDFAIKFILLILFFGVMVGIGLYCRRHATDVSGFVLGGRSVGPWLTAFAYGTSYFSAVVFVGYAGQFGWKYGVAATWAGLGNAFLGSLLAWVVLGRRTRVMTQHLDSATMPEFFGKRFESQSLKLCASAIIFIFLIPYTASLYNGLSRLFAMAFSIDYSVCVVVMAVLTAVYVIAGGYMATAINDFIQGIIMLAGIAAVILAVLQLLQLAEPIPLPRLGQRALPAVTAVWAALFLLFCLNTNNLLYTASDQAHRATQSYATRLLARIESCEGYEPGMEIAVVGAVPSSQLQSQTESFRLVRHYSVPTGTVLTLNKHIYYYFSQWLNTPVKELDEAVMQSISDSREFQAMPLYPAPGSVQVMNGRVVVRMAEKYTPKAPYEVAYENRR